MASLGPTDPDRPSRSISLDREGPLPLYYQLREHLRGIARDLGPGVLMPSENEMITLTGVSRATVRKAISDLVHEGLLHAHRGRGTFTANRFQTPLDRPAGFTETVRQLGRRPSSQVLSVERTQATPDAGARLQIPTGADMFVIERLRLIDDEPAMHERLHVATELAPRITDADLGGSLYELLALDYGLVPVRGTETIIAVNADHRLARILDVPVASALLATTRVTATAAGTPIEYTLRHARGDMCSFAVQLGDGSQLLPTAQAVG